MNIDAERLAADKEYIRHWAINFAFPESTDAK